MKLFPNVSPYDPTDPTGYNIDGQILGQGANLRALDNSYTNILFALRNNKMRAKNDRVIGNIYGKVNIIDGLSARTQFGIDYVGNMDFLSWDPRHGDGFGSGGTVTNSWRQVTRWNAQNTLNYDKDFGDHGINLTAGSEFQQTTVNSFFGRGQGFADLFFMSDNLISDQFVTPTSGGTYAQNGFISYFSRLNYSFKDKYLLGFSVRNDALSNLPKTTRNGVFYGGSVGYRLSEEEFYRNLGIEAVLSSVKLRASWIFPISELIWSWKIWHSKWS